MRQIKKRGRPFEQEISLDYLEKINSGYLDFFKQNSNTKIILLNTENLDFVSSVEDLNQVFEVFEESYSTGVQVVDGF